MAYRRTMNALHFTETKKIGNNIIEYNPECYGIYKFTLMSKKKYGCEIEYVLSCVKKIDKMYYQINGINLKGEEIIEQAGENAFTAELYYYLRTDQKKLGFDDLCWHFDLQKTRVNKIRPDLVLHNSPDDDEDQRIFLEVKTNRKVSSSDITKDLDKLKKAVSRGNSSYGYLGYKFGVYIVGNCKNIETIIQNFGYELKIAEKLYLISFQSGDFKPKVKKFSDLDSDSIHSKS